MPKNNELKKKLDRKRTEWRKTHRTLDGKVILYPDKNPEHVNARGSKVYNWFWKNILLPINQQEIPAIISTIKNQITSERDTKKIQIFRTMIGMAEDAYQLKNLDDILDYDAELQYGKKPVFDAEQGVIYKDGKIFTIDYSEDESDIILRDVEGVIIDLQKYENKKNNSDEKDRKDLYENWDYSVKK